MTLDFISIGLNLTIKRQSQYVKEKVFGIDFDKKSVRVARMLNIIAGNGHTNVLNMNSLDFEMWDENLDDEDWQRLKKLRTIKGKSFDFDMVMANPPFAGDIKESRILHRYELGKKPNGRYQTKVGRDILFIERNLDMLKSGVRMTRSCCHKGALIIQAINIFEILSPSVAVFWQWWACIAMYSNHIQARKPVF